MTESIPRAAILAHPRRWGPQVGWFPVLFGLAIALLFLLPTGLAGSPATAPASAPSTPAATGTPLRAAVSSGPSTSSLPGGNPALNEPVTAQSLGLIHASRVFGPTSLVHAVANVSNVSSAGASNAPPPPGATPIPPEGWFTGTVTNGSATTQGLSGVTVQAFADASSDPCPIAGPGACLPTATHTDGTFNVTCEAGPDYITYQRNYFAENISYANCLNNTAVNVGTVFLVPDGVIVGSVHVDESGFPALSGVQVQGCNRGCTVVTPPTVSTNSTGGFRVPVPPGTAAELNFIPPGTTPIFAQNFTTTEAAAGQTVNIGTVYLEPNSIVKAELYDAVTGAPITGAAMAITVCSLTTTVCGPQGPTVSGPAVEAVGPPGYDYAVVMAQIPNVRQYLVNTTPIGDVPLTSHGQPYCVPYDCKIYLTPLGEVETTVGISGNWTHLFDSQNTGLYTISVSSLNGYSTAAERYNPATYSYNMTTTTTMTAGCQSVTSLVADYAFPYRNTVTVAPDTGGLCSFSGIPTWPIPGDLPVWSNTTVFNGTPDEVTHLAYLNLTPGAYVMGSVYAAGSTLAPTGGFTVKISSRVSSSLTTYSWPSTYGFYPPSPCNQGAGSGTVFCAPAPPGPDVLKVSATNYPQNETWVSVPWSTCCVRQNISAHAPKADVLPLWNVTAPNVTSINLTISPSLSGTIDLAGSTTPVPYAAVTVCLAASQVTGGCDYAITNFSGGYSFPSVTPGWEYVTATASGDQANSEWVNVSGPTVAPTIPIQRDATLIGTVLSSTGTPIIGAGITYCLIDSSGTSNACSTNLGAGVTQSDGNYLGLVQGGAFPYSTYEIEADAPGYVPDWTFVNVTANSTINVPTLYLPAIGESASPAARGAAAEGPFTAGSGNTWVTGRVVDNVTGDGVVVNAMTACSVSNPANCVSFTLGTNSGGFFNQSMPTDTYNLSISASGYAPLTVPLNALAIPHVDAGTIYLTPLTWVIGNVTMDPWSTINVTYSLSPLKWVHILLVSTVNAEVCASDGVCDPSVPAATSGLFQAQASPGFLEQVEGIGNAPGGTYSAQGGVETGFAEANITTGETALPTNAWPAVKIFATVSGTLWNSNSWNTTLENYTNPARWAQVQVTTSGAVINAVVTELSNASGGYTVFLPGGNPANNSKVISGGTGLDIWYTNQTSIPAILGPEQNLTYTVAPIPLVQFGWADLTVRNSATGAPVAGTGVSASYTNAVNGRSGSSSDSTNTGGYLNLSAPSGVGVDFLVGGSEDYNTTAFVASVPSAGTVILTEGSSVSNGTVEVEPWGWVGSTYVNYATPAHYAGAIVDQHTGLPIPNAEFSVASSDPVYGYGSSQPSNALGQFLSDAPVGPGDVLTASHDGFVVNTTHPLKVSSGATVLFPTVNLTGYGVVVGQVVGLPGLAPVPNAQVKICPGTSSFSQYCVSQVTNATGWYWTTAFPSLDTIFVSAPNYLANYTETFTVSTDSWTHLPAYVLVKYGGIAGVVRGLPTGLPVAGATVAVCSPVGTPVGPCSTSVGSLANGSFAVAIVPGTFVIAASALDYNTTYRPVAVTPGEIVNVGSVFLTEFGVVTGKVVDSITGDPIVNATVDACPTDTQLSCSPTQITDSAGSYRIAADPGQIALSFSAPSYEDGYLTVTVVSGGTLAATTVALIPVADESQRAVSGRVAPDTNPSGGIAGAVVSFYVGETRAYTTIASGTGLFSLDVIVGTYTVVATAAGYGSAQQTVDVTQSVSNLLFTLAVWGWNVTLSVSDGLTLAPLAGASASSGTASLGTTDAAGQLVVSLPNGSYAVTVQPPASLGSEYAPVSFVVEVSDAAVDRVVDLYPALASLSGTVRSSAGAPVGDATVTLSGTAADGATYTVTRTTDLSGTFDLPAYAGSYTVTANATGYEVASQGVSLTGGPATLSLSMTPAAVTSSGSGSSATSVYLIAGVGVALAVAAVAALLLFGRRRRDSP